jgi:hypothetical protein
MILQIFETSLDLGEDGRAYRHLALPLPCTKFNDFVTSEIFFLDLGAAFRIRDVYPGSRIGIFPILDRNFSHLGSEFFHFGSASKNFVF